MRVKVWEEDDRTPNFVLEITSKTTRSKDQGAKKGIYAFLGVEEYYQYDPTADYLDPPLQGWRLVNGSYIPVATTTLADGAIILPSPILGLELHQRAQEMRFYAPATSQYLRTYEEEVAARQTAEERAQTAEERAQKLADRLRELNIDPDAV